jgi:hypothetical protein
MYCHQRFFIKLPIPRVHDIRKEKIIEIQYEDFLKTG